MVTLIKGSLLVLLILYLFSCNEINKDKISLRNLYLNQNFVKYKKVYEVANDSIVYWIKDSLDVIKPIFFGKNEWQLDSIFIFNKDSTRFYTLLNKRDLLEESAIFDYQKDFGGAKIDGKWYFFFMGVSRPVRREDWQDSVYAALSFEELSYVAYNKLFKTLVKNINEGHPEKNEEIFNKRIFYDKECSSTNNPDKCIDDAILLKVAGEYKYKLDPEEIASIQRSISESKLPEGVPLVKSYSWWEIYKYGQKPFETKAWKEYIKQKYGKE